MVSPIQIRVASSMDEVDAEAWDRLLTGSESAGDGSEHNLPNPFMRHAFLTALEKSGSATVNTGWLGQHLLLEAENGEILGALPCYLKNHSQGEYVFDHGWADAFERAGGRYYPKLQSSVPFTPATGPRLLVADDANQEQNRLALFKGLEALGDRHGVSSAHITFMTKPEWDLAGKAGFMQRTDQQFHWYNDNYNDFNDFLAALSSRKRKNIRKERDSALAHSGISIERLTGSDLTEAILDQFFEFYIDTGSRKWGHPYLTREFFSQIADVMSEQVVLIMAKRNGNYIAGAINFVGGDCLYGRHWGCVEDHPCLHFEVCYYQAIDYAIENQIARVEAGAQGAHKLARGYVPVTTHSAHWISHAGLRRAIQDYLQHERKHVEMESEALREHAPFKKA